MGIQVDPLFGSKVEDERLYLRFANLGNDVVTVKPMEPVFNIEFQTVDGDVGRESLDILHGPRRPTWDRLLSLVGGQAHPSWSYATRVQVDLKTEVERVEKVFQPVVMFGIFLVAATLLGVVLSILLSMTTRELAPIPSWANDWVWAILLVTMGLSSAIVAAIGAATAFRFIRGK